MTDGKVRELIEHKRAYYGKFISAEFGDSNKILGAHILQFCDELEVALAESVAGQSTMLPNWKQVVLGLSWIPLHYRQDVIRNIETVAQPVPDKEKNLVAPAKPNDTEEGAIGNRDLSNPPLAKAGETEWDAREQEAFDKWNNTPPFEIGNTAAECLREGFKGGYAAGRSASGEQRGVLRHSNVTVTQPETPKPIIQAAPAGHAEQLSPRFDVDLFYDQLVDGQIIKESDGAPWALSVSEAKQICDEIRKRLAAPAAAPELSASNRKWLASTAPRPEIVAVSETIWGIRYDGQMLCAPTIDEAVSVWRDALRSKAGQ